MPELMYESSIALIAGILLGALLAHFIIEWINHKNDKP